MSAPLQAAGLALAGRLCPTDLEIGSAQLVCLVGPNGSGKTSLLHALAGIGSPAGRVRIEGIDPAALGPGARSRLLSYLPASRDAAWPLTARDLVRLGLPAGTPPGEADRMLDALDLAALGDRRVDRLSTGERSRVLIARALAARSRLLLLDEPTANLDPLWQLILMERLQAAAREDGQTVLVAVHDLDLAARYAERLIVMANGAIAADGEPRALIAGPVIARVFGIARSDGEWRALTRPGDRRSSP
jgi:iron complex transport system ATP-binding protein